MAVYPTNPYNSYTPIPSNGMGYNTNNISPAYQPQASAQTQFSNIIVIPVQSKEGASSYPVAPGAKVLLMDYDHRKFWLKTNNNGVSMTMVEHTFVAENDTTNDVESKSNTYVTRKEFEEMQKMLEDLTKPS